VKNPYNFLIEKSNKKINIPSCEHYVNTISQLEKIIKLQLSQPRYFDVIIDLEDGAGDINKEQHLSDFIAAAKLIPEGIRFGVRILDFAHEFAEIQLAHILQHLGTAIAYITLPKISSPVTIDYAENIMRRYSDNLVPLHVLIETQQAIVECNAIAAHPCVEALDFGIIDFINDHEGVITQQAMSSPMQFKHALIQQAKTTLVAAATHYGKVAAHNVCVDLQNSEQAFMDAKCAHLYYGFTRMLSIHPTQIEPIIRGFSSSTEELEELCSILQMAKEANWKPIRYKNIFYDLPNYKYCFKKLQTAMQYGQLGNTDIFCHELREALENYL
jgi:citrate lyase subunit beta/citryl-CoA lyase